MSELHLFSHAARSTLHLLTNSRVCMQTWTTKQAIYTYEYIYMYRYTHDISLSLSLSTYTYIYIYAYTCIYIYSYKHFVFLSTCRSGMHARAKHGRANNQSNGHLICYGSQTCQCACIMHERASTTCCSSARVRCSPSLALSPSFISLINVAIAIIVSIISITSIVNSTMMMMMRMLMIDDYFMYLFITIILIIIIIIMCIPPHLLARPAAAFSVK